MAKKSIVSGRPIYGTTVEGKTMDEERALYGSTGIRVISCRFDGPADGESALKESKIVLTEDCFFNLRYPLWHVTGLRMNHCVQTDKCRAAIWYTKEALISDCVLHGIKAVRECADIAIRNCDIISPEFGWMCANVTMENTSCEGEYFLLHTDGIHLNNVRLNGKYSFQYVKGGLVENSVLNTKDAFWHAQGVTVRNCVIRGEYLGWYSDGLTLDHCTIIGTQPLCYCKNLTLIDCVMQDTDLAFEKSDVEATVASHVDSIKNPKSGSITVHSVGEIIKDDPDAKAVIVVTEQKESE